MRTKITIEGTKPLLMHQDNILWSEKVKDWTTDPDNKSKSTPGDDRSPAFTWIGALYHDGEIVTMPSDNIMTMLREGGAQVRTGKGQQTFKAQTQSGIIPLDCDWPLYVDNKTIDVSEVLALEFIDDFAEHERVVIDHGFDLFVKRAKIGRSKHIRVRPIFRQWKVSGSVEIIDDQITVKILESILSLAGRLKGLGDWRSSSKTSGGFGTFISTVEVI